jgi:TonB-linked SusC/RagA family outer membrane protein
MKKVFLLTIGLLLIASQTLLAQSLIKGRVLEEDGDPAVGATVRVKGTNKGTYTESNGNFSIAADDGTELLISYLGYKPLTVAAANGMVIKLNKDSKSVGEVVVTAFGQKRQSKELGYSTASVGGQELNQARVINPLNGLTGKVSGLQIQTSNNGVNPAVRITLRGNRSILGNNQALIVVDGTLVDNDFFSKLNPNDIESTNILKGASASALYGSEASNGVVIVTTKKGVSAKGKSKVAFSSTVQGERAAYMPKFQNRFGSYGGEAFDQILGIQFPNDPSKIYFPYENQSFGPEYNGEAVPLGGPVSVTFADGQNADLTRYIDYNAVEDGKKNFFNTGITLQNSISIASGDAASNLFLSYQNVKVTGIVPKDKADRNIFRINGGRSFGKVKLDFNTTYTNEILDQVGGSYFQDRPLYWTIVNAPQHTDFNTFRDWRNNPFASPDGYFNAYYGNPWWQIDESRQKANNNFLVGNIKASLAITNWLTAAYTVGLTRNDYDRRFEKNGFTFADWAIADPWAAGTIPSSTKFLAPSFGSEKDNRTRVSGDATLTARKNFGDISTKLLLGQSIWKRTRKVVRTSTQSLVFPGLYNIAYRQGEPLVGAFEQNNALVGMYADAVVGYKDYLFLHGSVRNDRDSRLATANQSFYYPSVDMAFIFTDAIAGLRDHKKVLNFGKIRAGIAKVGQVNIDPYSLQNIVVPGAGFPYGTNAGYSISDKFNNPNLKPEFTTESEVGLDLGFFDSRLNVGLSVYSAKTTNQTLPADISSASGGSTSVQNIGSMTNKGFEVDLRLTPLVKLGGVRWNMGLTYANNKNQVGLDLPNEVSLSTVATSVFAVPGQAYPYIKESDWERDPSGRIIVDALTGLPTKAAALSGFGTTVPRKNLGITSSWTYKSFTISAVADARFGAVINNLIGEDLDFTGISWYSAQTGRQPFIIPNSVVENADGSFTENTNVVVNDANWAFFANNWNRTHSHYVNSGDFWKLRELALSYNIPAKLLGKSKYIQGANVTLSGRNLLLFRPKDNVWTDPEFSDVDADNAVGTTTIRQTPPTRIYGVTLNLNF